MRYAYAAVFAFILGIAIYHLGGDAQREKELDNQHILKRPQIPLFFEKNEGQMDPVYDYMARGKVDKIYFAKKPYSPADGAKRLD